MRISALLVFSALVLGATTAAADPGRGGVQPLDHILSQMRSGRAGTFYDADGPFPDNNGGMHYRIKWLTPEGRLIWLDTDARTGRVLGVERNGVREDEQQPRGDRPDTDRPDSRGRDHFDNDRRPDYDNQPRENFPRDPRWPRWQNGNPVGGGQWQDRGGGQWHDRGEGGGRWRDGHHGGE
ncbi:MAG TPA: hypothetical protein VGT78_07185 [Rhizomicrobium sp.]|nr:hypothetical protein [Rhizomicrobium sp.]